MAVTRDFRQTTMARAGRDPAFRVGLLTEALNSALDGDLETGKSLLRDYINATGSINEIARTLDKNDKSIRRMLGPDGNPSIHNFFGIVNACRQRERITLRVDAERTDLAGGGGAA